MKKFVYKCFSFIVIALISTWALQQTVDFGLKRLNTHSATQTSVSELLSDTLNADIVVMGNSRALCSYNPAVLEHTTGKKVWNIGVSGQPFGISYMRYQLYALHNKKPQLVIINIDNNELDMIANGFGREEYYPYFSDSVIQSCFDLYGFTWKHKYIPMYKYFGDYKLIGYGVLSAAGIYPFPPQKHYHGFSNSNHVFDGENMRNKLAADSLISVEHSEEAICLLKRFIEDSQRENIRLLFCYAPQYQELYKHLMLDSCMHVYKQMSEKYNIPLVDYSSVSWAGDSTYFYNANHVNLHGSEVFSAYLAHDLDSLDGISPWSVYNR